MKRLWKKVIKMFVINALKIKILALQKLKKWAVKVENVKEPNLVFGKFEPNLFQKEEVVSAELLKDFDSELRKIYDSLAPSTSTHNFQINKHFIFIILK